MTGIFKSPKWDIDACSEKFNTKIFGKNTRKLSKIREKSKKKTSKSEGATEKYNKTLPDNVQEQFHRTKSSPRNTKDRVKSKTEKLSPLALKKNKHVLQNEEFGTEQRNNKIKKKQKKKHKTSDENRHIHRSSSHVPVGRTEPIRNQSQLLGNSTKASSKHFSLSEGNVVLDADHNMTKKEFNQSYLLQNGSQKFKLPSSLKRKFSAVSAEAEYDEQPTKKQMTESLDFCDPKSITENQRKKKIKLKRSVIEPLTDEVKTLTGSLQMVDEKGFSQKKLKGKLNKAFSPDSDVLKENFHSDSREQKRSKSKKLPKHKTSKDAVNKNFSGKCNISGSSNSSSGDKPKQTKVKRYSQYKSKGIVNEAFSAESSIQDDSFNNIQVAKEFKIKGRKKQKSKGIVNEAFSDESSLHDQSFNYNHQVPKEFRIKGRKKKQKSEGIVNEAFSAESSLQHDSFDHNLQVVKELQSKVHQKKQKCKGFVNKAFEDGDSRFESPIHAKRQVPEQERTPPWHILDNLESGQRPSRKILAGTTLRERMIAKLKASRFRYLNEQIYSSESREILRYFANDLNSFKAYHEGFRHQISQWPLNPLDKIINTLKKKPKTMVIADFGCGDARLARSVPNIVHSFDVAALSEDVTVCDMSHTPLKKESVDIAVFCLSLMGTNLVDYILEANRVLVVGGLLKIAEVESRFEDVGKFILDLKKFGFTNVMKDLSHDMFYFLDFRKDDKPAKRNALPQVTLKPCLYKKR